MGESSKLLKAFRLFDTANARDPNKEYFQGEQHPREMLYAQRMTEQLHHFAPGASECLKLAARCQHLCRWEIPRESYPPGRIGYLNWRHELQGFHAAKASGILLEAGYSKDAIERVSFLLQKKKLRRDPETQTLEDVICLVFLRYYLEPFAAKHEDDKIVDILRKTWKKMSEDGREAALDIPFAPGISALIEKAIARDKGGN